MGNCFVKPKENKKVEPRPLVHRSHRRRRPKWLRCLSCVSASAVDVNNPLAETLLPTSVAKATLPDVCVVTRSDESQVPENIPVSDGAIEVAAVITNDSDDDSHTDAVRHEPVEEVNSLDDNGEDANNIGTEAGEEVADELVAYELEDGIPVDGIEDDEFQTEDTTTTNETEDETVTDYTDIEFDGHTEEETTECEIVPHHADIEYDRYIDEEAPECDVVDIESDASNEEETTECEIATENSDIERVASIDSEEEAPACDVVDIECDQPIEEETTTWEIATEISDIERVASIAEEAPAWDNGDIESDAPTVEETTLCEIATDNGDIEYDRYIGEEAPEWEVVDIESDAPNEEEILTYESCNGIHAEYSDTNNDAAPTVDGSDDTIQADQDYISSEYATVIYVREYEGSVNDGEGSVEDPKGITEYETNVNDGKSSNEDPTPVACACEITAYAETEVKPLVEDKRVTHEGTTQDGSECALSFKDSPTTHKGDAALHADTDKPDSELENPKSEVNTISSIGNEQPVRDNVQKEVSLNEGYFIQKQKSNRAITSVSSEIRNCVSILKCSASRRKAPMSHAAQYANGSSVADIKPRYASGTRIRKRGDTSKDAVKERISTRCDASRTSVKKRTPKRDSVNEMIAIRHDISSDAVKVRIPSTSSKETDTQETRAQAAGKAHRQRDAVRVIPVGRNHKDEDKDRNDTVDMLGRSEHEDDTSRDVVKDRVLTVYSKPRVTQEARVLAPDQKKPDDSEILLVANKHKDTDKDRNDTTRIVERGEEISSNRKHSRAVVSRKRALSTASKRKDVVEQNVLTPTNASRDTEEEKGDKATENRTNGVSGATTPKSSHKSGYVDEAKVPTIRSEDMVRDAETVVHLPTNSEHRKAHDDQVLLGKRKPKVKTNLLPPIRASYHSLRPTDALINIDDRENVQTQESDSNAVYVEESRASTSRSKTRSVDEAMVPKSSGKTKTNRGTKYVEEARKINYVGEASVRKSGSKTKYVDEARVPTSGSRSRLENKVIDTETVAHLQTNNEHRKAHDDRVRLGNRKPKVKMKLLPPIDASKHSLRPTGAMNNIDDRGKGKARESGSRATAIKHVAAEAAATDDAGKPRAPSLKFLQLILDLDEEKQDETHETEVLDKRLKTRQKKKNRGADIATAGSRSVNTPQTFPRELCSMKSQGSKRGKISSKGQGSPKRYDKDTDDIEHAPLFNSWSFQMVKNHNGKSDVNVDVYVRSPYKAKARRVKLNVTRQDLKQGLVPNAFGRLTAIKEEPKASRGEIEPEYIERKKHMFTVPGIAKDKDRVPAHSWIQTTGVSNKVRLTQAPAYNSRPGKVENIREQLGIDALKQLGITVQCRQIERIKVYYDEFPGILPKSQSGKERVANVLSGEDITEY